MDHFVPIGDAESEDADFHASQQIDEQIALYQELAAEFDGLADGHAPKRPPEWLRTLPGERSLRVIEAWRAESVEWSQSPGTADWWREQAARLRARAAKLHDLEHPRIGPPRPRTAEERAAVEERDA